LALSPGSFSCECEGCSPSAYDTCRVRADSDAAFSDRVGCGPLLDELLACEDATGFCRVGRGFETDCGLERDRWGHCVNGR